MEYCPLASVRNPLSVVCVRQMSRVGLFPCWLVTNNSRACHTRTSEAQWEAPVPRRGCRKSPAGTVRSPSGLEEDTPAFVRRVPRLAAIEGSRHSILGAVVRDRLDADHLQFNLDIASGSAARRAQAQ